MNKAEKAKNLFISGYNCSQSVFGAFCEDFAIDFDTAMIMSSGFGGGMGRLREVCGAFSGIVMVLSLKYGYKNADDIEKKKELYKHIQNLAQKFKQDNTSIICKELLGLVSDSSPNPSQRTTAYYRKRPCPELVAYAARILDDYLKQNQ